MAHEATSTAPEPAPRVENRDEDQPASLWNARNLQQSPMNAPLIGFRKFLLPGIALLLVLLAGCSTRQIVPGARPDLLAFLQDGSTTRADAILHLGQPSSTLERDSILTFRIGEDVKQGYYLIAAQEHKQWQWESARYSLVLVFNAEGVLQKHNLVLVK